MRKIEGDKKMKKIRKPALTVFAMLLAVLLFAGRGTRGESAGPEMAALTPTAGRYASVNGLRMYYEIHGTGRPLVLLHGALCTIDGCFGKILPLLAKTRQVIAIEQQAHGHTADIDRPLTTEQMAEDTVALVRQLRIENADFFGYSMGAGIALQIALRYPHRVRKLVVAAAGYNREGFHPGILEGIEKLKPQDFAGSRWIEAYKKVAPNPNGWPGLLARVNQQVRAFKGWSPEAIRSIKAPTLVMIGDSDVIRPEHAVQMFRLLGGGVAGDIAGLPRSQLAVLPGTTHVTLVDRAGWLVSMVTQFLDATMSPGSP